MAVLVLLFLLLINILIIIGGCLVQLLSLAERITFLKKESKSLLSDKQLNVEKYTTVVVETSD